MNSIKDIAIKAKVSTGTVDRVIHNRPGVSEKTKTRILKIIKESNYTVNTVASLLASKKTFTFATLLPESFSLGDFWSTPKQGIDEAISEIKSLGIKIKKFEFNQFEVKTYTKAFIKMAQSKPSGVLIAPIFNDETKKLTKLLEEQQIPYVFINTETDALNNISFIGQSSYQGGFLAAKLLNKALPKNSEIAILEIRKNIENYTAINNRIQGFKDYFNKTDKTVSIKNLNINHINDSSLVNNQLKEYFNQYPNIKGIFVPSSKINSIAQSLVYLKKTTIELGGFDITPENVKFLKNDTIDFLISQKPYQQGYDGIKILFNYIIHKKEPKKSYYLPIEIVVKENVDFL